MAPHYRITYMPWLGLDKPQHFGEISVTPLEVFLARSDLPPGTECFLRSFFRHHIESNGEPVRSICIVHTEPLSMAASGRNIHDRAYALASLLALLCIGAAISNAITQKNRRLAAPAGDRFQVITKLFGPEDDAVVVSAGRTLTYIQLTEFRLQRPWHVTPSPFSLPNREAASIAEFLKHHPDSHFVRRASQAAVWFRLAHGGGDEIDWRPRLVMLATAFEALLDAGQSNKKNKLMKTKIDCLFERKSDSRFAYPRAIRQLSHNRAEHTRAAWFLHEMYELRNSIIHGDLPLIDEHDVASGSLPWLTKLSLGSLLLWECFMETALQEGAFDAIVDRQACEFRASDNKRTVPPEMWNAFARATIINEIRSFDQTNVVIGWAERVGEASA